MTRSLFSLLLYKVPGLHPFLEAILYRLQRVLLRFYGDEATAALIRSIYREGRIRVQPFEALLVYQLAAMRSRSPGAMAEVGVAAGGTAKLICTAAAGKDFFGFDTFAGLPHVEPEDRHWGVQFFKPRQYAADEESVRSYLAPFKNVHLVRGMFPESANDLHHETFGFVHLDADLYKSTKEALQFFWPRMTPGGVILLHDFHVEGVRRAIREFIEEQAIGSYFKAVCSQFVILKP